MGHHAPVLEIEIGELLKVVGEALALREVLPETAEAAVERMPSCIDDARLRENETDQTHGGKVIGHLVSEEGLAATVTAGAIQVVTPQPGEFCIGDPGERVGIALFRVAARDFGDCPADVRQFGRALDQRMTGEYLLK